MILEKYLKDRELWQENTIQEIKKRILFKSLGNSNHIRSEKLVSVYGPSQIGKTTLILKLIGISEEYQSVVYRTLRAGIPKGNSSTSTAIMYQQIDSEKYGIKYGDGFSNIEYCDETELKDKINKIRSEVEDNNYGKDILHIYIPMKFFKDKKASGINIVDLPGTDSRNLREKSHVESVIAKYLALSNVNIIVCKANVISSLETLNLPINVDWKKLPHKYMVVITSSYSLASIRNFFKTKKRDKHFFEYVDEYYHNDLKKLMPQQSEIELYPIDLGESYQQLLNYCNLDKNEQIEVQDTASKVIEKLRDAIQKKQGNSLKSTIMDLKSYLSINAEEKYDELKNTIENLKKEKENYINVNKDKDNIILMYQEKKDTLKLIYDKYNMLCNLKFQGWHITDNSINDIVQKYSCNGKVKDKQGKLIEDFRDILLELITKYLEEYELERNALEIYTKINNQLYFEDIIREKVKNKGLFAKHIKEVKFLYECKELLDKFSNEIIKQIQKLIELESTKLQSEYESYKLCVEYEEINKLIVEKNEEKISHIGYEVERLNEELEGLSIRIDEDKKLIENYLMIAKQEFYKYKEMQMTKIDSKDISADEKVIILLYLCLLEKDYKSIVEME